jgi:hypothetical protein
MCGCVAPIELMMIINDSVVVAVEGNDRIQKSSDRDT